MAYRHTDTDTCIHTTYTHAQVPIWPYTWYSWSGSLYTAPLKLHYTHLQQSTHETHLQSTHVTHLQSSSSSSSSSSSLTSSSRSSIQYQVRFVYGNGATGPNELGR